MFFRFPFSFENSSIWLHHQVSLVDTSISFFNRKQTQIIVKPLVFDGKGLGFSTNLESFLHLGFSVSSVQTAFSVVQNQNIPR